MAVYVMNINYHATTKFNRIFKKFKSMYHDKQISIAIFLPYPKHH